MIKQTKKTGFKAFLALFTLLKSYRWLYSASLLALGLTVTLEMGGFMVIRHVVDEILILGPGLTFLIFWAGVYLLLALIKGGLSYFHGRAKAHCAEKVTQNIRNGLYDHLQRLSFAYHDTSQTGELVQRSTSDVDTVRKFFANQIPELGHVFFQFFINLGILLFLEWRLALFSVIVVPVVGLVSTVFFFKSLTPTMIFRKPKARCQIGFRRISLVSGWSGPLHSRTGKRKIQRHQRSPIAKRTQPGLVEQPVLALRAHPLRAAVCLHSAAWRIYDDSGDYFTRYIHCLFQPGQCLDLAHAGAGPDH